jgi:hypothetical protein
MTVQFGYNKKEVMDGLRGHFIGRLEIRILIIVINVFALISFFLLVFRKIPSMPFLIFAFLWFTLWISIRWLLPFSIYKRSATFKDNFVLSLTDQGVLLKTKKGNQLWRWEDFSAFKETIYFFHVYFNPRSFFMIPKDSFKDITEIQAARKLLRERIKK